jgi:threonine dehydrogenase-like Zn-dependent dehydrogenase
VAGVTNPKRPVIFECVGIPGMIESIVADAPLRSCIVVVGVCMKRDHFFPVNAINKEIDLRFTLGYMPIEFRDALHMIAEGKVNVGPMITGTVGLSAVDDAFAALGNPEQHAKILIDPGKV